MEHVTKMGRVVSFSTSTSSGSLEVETKAYDFPSTSFRAVRTPRFPKPGESVEVVLKTTEDGCKVLAVCARDER